MRIPGFSALPRAAVWLGISAIAAFPMALRSDIQPVPEKGGVMIVEKLGDAGAYPVFLRWTSHGDAVDGAQPGNWEFSLDASAAREEGMPLLVLRVLGTVMPFVEEADGSFSCNPLLPARLQRVDEGLSLNMRSGQKFFFSKDGRLKTMRSTDGRTLVFSHNPAGKISEWSLKSDRGTEVSFDDKLGMSGSSPAAAGISGALTWDAEGRPATLRCDDKTFKLEYDGKRLKAITDGNGKNRMEYTYDEAGRIVRVSWADGRFTRINYDAKGRLAGILDEEFEDEDEGGGIVVEYGNQFQDNVVNVWDMDQRKHTKYTFEPTLALIEEGPIDADFVLRTRIDRTNGSETVESADGAKFHMSLGPEGTYVVKSVIPGSLPLVTVSKPGASLVTATDQGAELYREMFSYSGSYAEAVASKLFSSLGGVRSERGDLIRLMAGGAPTASFKYDAKGNLSAISVPGGGDTKFSYDEQGRLVRRENPEGQVSTLSYDEEESSVTEKFPGDILVKTCFEKDSGLPMKSIEAGLRETSFAYDSDDNLVSLVMKGFDSLKYYPPDDEDQDSVIESEVFGKWCFMEESYDVQIRIAPDGAVTRYQVDEKDRVTRIWAEDLNAPYELFEYNEAGRPVRGETAGGAVEFYYDKYGRPSGEKDLGAGISYTYIYDARGGLECVKDSGGASLEYQRDGSGSATELRSSLAGTIKITYGCYGLPVSVKRPNGVETSLQYDRCGRVTECSHSLKGKIISAWRYSYDALGNLSLVEGPSGKTKISYDALSQVSGLNHGGRDGKVAFDTWGNLLQRGATKIEYASPGRPSKAGEGLLACDAAGCLSAANIGSGEWRFSYDYDGRLADASCGSAKHAWAYGPIGQVSLYSAPDGKRTRFSYSAGILSASKTEGSAKFTRYIMLPDTAFCLAIIAEDGSVRYPLWDAGGSITQLSDASGALGPVRTFDPLGLSVGEDSLGIFQGWGGALCFAGGQILFAGDKPYFMPLLRALSPTAPQPGQLSLSLGNPLSLLNGNPCDVLNRHLLPGGDE